MTVNEQIQNVLDRMHLEWVMGFPVDIDKYAREIHEIRADKPPSELEKSDESKHMPAPQHGSDICMMCGQPVHKHFEK